MDRAKRTQHVTTNDPGDATSATTTTATRTPATLTPLALWDSLTPRDSLTPLAYRPEAAARTIGISRSALYLELASGRLRSVKIGRSRVITHAAIVDFLAQLEDVEQ